MIVFMKKTIILTGGGTAGHVTPNLSLIPLLKKHKFDIHYIGSINGIEKDIISKLDNVKYHSIRTGKLRRYFSWQNFTDPFKVIAGYFDAKKIISEIKPDIVFSKGGFVSVPVVAAAHNAGVPVVAHESDITPGLANKISKRYANTICFTFPDSLEKIKPPIGVYTGSPIRSELFEGDKEKARNMLGFDKKQVILVMGGSLGSRIINEAVRKAIKEITAKYNVIHICGKGNVKDSIDIPGYRQFEYVTDELPDYMALSNYIISRAGSNSIHEFLALKKPMILIPLSTKASRGDQILNARSFEKRGFAIVLNEENLSSKTLIKAIMYLENDAQKMIKAMEKENHANGTEKIFNIIMEKLSENKAD